MATVTYSKDSVVDVNRIQQILDNDKPPVIKKSQTSHSTGNLIWLLILLIILALIAALALILCCICQGCPLYVPPKKRKISPRTNGEEIKQLVRGSGQGRESKSVQVAEWFGRKEAWSPEHVVVDESESLRRHEIDRGSDRGEIKRTIHRQQNVPTEVPRDQFYIREGNADILRLITRGGGEVQRPVTLIEQNYDTTGKEILMKRYIDQQQSEVINLSLPNAVNKLQTEHELLETSLRQQNALLRQILMERERDLRLETQSLPAGTQTDQDAGTQTEAEYLRGPGRKARSDNDASEDEDEELYLIRSRVKMKKRNDRTGIRRKIRTPILEESDEIHDEKSYKQLIKQTKTSELRQKRAASTKSGIEREVLKEISDSLDHSDEDEDELTKPKNRNRKTKNHLEKSEDEKLQESSSSRQSKSRKSGEIIEELVSSRPRRRRSSHDYFTEDSLEEISPRSEKTTSSDQKPRYYSSETDLRLISSRQQEEEQRKASNKMKKSQSHTDLKKIKLPSQTTQEKTKKSKKSMPRYMECYNKNKNIKKEAQQSEVKETEISKEKEKKITSRLLQGTQSSNAKKKSKTGVNLGPEHPLLQHSEHRFEAQYPVRRGEEDADSGIVLNRPAMAQKKSVFTIAYDDMHTNQLRPDTTSPPL